MPGPATRPYRILLTTFQDFGAGSIQSVEYLAEGLHRRGHHLLVACPADGVLGRRLRQRGVPLVDFRFARGWRLGSARRLARVIREHGAELVDAQESRDRKAAILARALLGAKTRLVVTRRQQTATFPLGNLLYALAADRVVAISQGVAESLVRKGTPRRKIRVVHTGLHPDRVRGDVGQAELDALRSEMGLDPRLPTVGVVARRKDQETLLRALARLGRPVNVLMVGIDRDPALEALEAALPAGTGVAYTGFRSRVLPFYRLLDVKVLTTRAEGLSQAILESMAMGVPVITATVGGTPEVVEDGVNGLHFSPGDDGALAAALARLLDDEALRRRLAEAGRATVAGPFHADAFVRRTEAVYHELLEGG
ncbi:MAG TPA: glycosyltransferase family 4 protein [Longimicrobiales bacterium]|nr:glycosyltransferase family 4 protein [Longimicrobiales bacterium]